MAFREQRFVVSKKSIHQLLGSPIAFHRVFAEISKSALAGLFLSQCYYWSDKTKDHDGWFYKGHTEWEEEICMTRREVDTARRHLVSLGVIEEKKRGIPCRLHFRVNLDNLMLLIEQTSLAESAKLECTKAPNSVGGKRQTITENTSETTTKNNNTDLSMFELTSPEPETNSKAKPKPIPDWVPLDAWDGYADMRKTMKFPMTDHAKNLELKELEKLKIQGYDPREVLEQSIRKCYRGLFKVNGQNGHQEEPEDDLKKLRQKEAARRAQQ